MWVASACSGAGDGHPGTHGEGIVGTGPHLDPTETRSDSGGETGKSNTETGGDSDGTPTIKFDLGPIPDANTNCHAGADEAAFRYIWVANSGQGTISKINTDTLIEEGRYRVRPDSAGSPSRTSVNLSGDVAVASRLGGITKVHARTDDCQEHNGQVGIQTSSGPNDILDWGTEECVAWYTPMKVSSQRPVAWDQGDFDFSTCESHNAKVWTATATNGVVTVAKLNGDNGTIEAATVINGIVAAGYGPYGGAVDGNRDFWFMHRDSSPAPLVRVGADTLDYTVWPVPGSVKPYGFAIDPKGRPWIAGYQGGTARFDPASESWQINPDVTGVGMMSDGLGVMWIAHYPWTSEGVAALDTETMELIDFIAVPASLGKGVSVDFAGYVWLVDMTDSAFRIDPGTHDHVVYTGLTGPYTYSDMTGFGLASVLKPQG
ncbi:Methionine ABC transporter ATP-binding protein [Enhygromyxa salina]|uniref:Methionine ABC transporter ATP-binding protein n=1 Tax=Enhygromyxa salina TaxID=215803 RepID=A0A0C2CXJ6_9BACT|nr:Methionine ABC transporter ATP-binding protein [Enhygromyxa salina]